LEIEIGNEDAFTFWRNYFLFNLSKWNSYTCILLKSDYTFSLSHTLHSVYIYYTAVMKERKKYYRMLDDEDTFSLDNKHNIGQLTGLARQFVKQNRYFYIDMQ